MAKRTICDRCGEESLKDNGEYELALVNKLTDSPKNGPQIARTSRAMDLCGYCASLVRMLVDSKSTAVLDQTKEKNDSQTK